MAKAPAFCAKVRGLKGRMCTQGTSLLGKVSVLIESQRVEMVEEVDILHVDVFRHLDASRGKVENGGDACIHQMGGRTLGAFRGRRDNADFNVVFGNDGWHVLGAVHFKSVNDFADLEGVAVEDGDNIESAFPEVRVIQKSLAEIADTDEGHAPLAIDIKCGGNGGNEGGDIVSDTTDAEFAEIGKILADL